MSELKSSDKIIDKASKSNVFPNITTAYAVLNSNAVLDSDASATIQQNNRKAP
ncbi:MAG: hypothetical protein H6Q73_3537 [Firmicutes bacterium]|nr:hypothetical protein [Bacillota bacterium]